MIRKKPLSLLLTLCMVLLLLPTPAWAKIDLAIAVGNETLTYSGEGPVYAKTTTDGVITLAGNENDYNIKWDGSTLTLNAATINASYDDDDVANNSAIFLSERNLIISLIGTNTLTANGQFTIHVQNGPLTIQNGDRQSGKLNVTNTNTSDGYGIAIKGADGITINSGVINASGSSDCSDVSYGFDSNGASITINGGTITAQSGSSKFNAMGKDVKITKDYAFTTEEGGALRAGTPDPTPIPTPMPSSTPTPSSSPGPNQDPVSYYKIVVGFLANFDANDGEGTDPTQKIVEEGKTLELPSCTRTGYTFLGWNDGTNTHKAGTKYEPDKHVTFTAQWQETFSVTFDANGGQGTNPTQSALAAGKTFELPSNPYTRDGYNFSGWNDGTNTYDPGDTYTMPANSVTLTAQWQEIPATFPVTFAPNGGQGINPTQVALAAGKTFKLPSNPYTRTGYTFSSWNDGTKTYAAGTTYTMPAKAVTLTAQWIQQGGSSGGGGGGGSSNNSPAPSPQQKAPIYIDGKPYDMGKETVVGNTTMVTIDQEQLTAQLQQTSKAISVPVSSQTGSSVVQLIVKNIEDMARKNMELTVDTGKVQYMLPTVAVNTEQLLHQLGATDSSKVLISTNITQLAPADIRLDRGTLIVAPLRFSITASYANKTVEVSTFDKYVNRIIEITENQAKSITTAIRVEDGAHVPTFIYQQDNKWYAKIHSRTNSTYALISYNEAFNDVSDTWYENVANELRMRQVADFFGTDFNGDKPITRGELATLVVKSLGLPKGQIAGFSDTTGNTYEGFIATAHAYGIINGYTDGTFKPNATITREEAMVMLTKAAKLSELAAKSGTLNSFKDVAKVGNWALPAVTYTVVNGLIVGDEEGNLNPQGPITRGEAATAVLRLLQNSKLIDLRNKI